MNGKPDSSAVDKPHVVLDAEAIKIRERRAKVWPAGENSNSSEWASQAADRDDYVGLALSGGGIRAASLGLGVLETLCNTGLIRSIDYLSTVSGGGYIGSRFSSAVVAKRVPPERAFEDTATNTAGNGERLKPRPGLPNNVRKLIYGGKYLYRPWEAANKYLIGLLMTTVVMLSGIVALAAAVALLWRLLDTVAVRDFLNLFDLNSDIVAAFLPFYFFGGCWFVAWMLSYFRFQAEAPGRWAQRCLYLAFAAALIGAVLLLANGKETKLGFLSVFLESGSKVESTGSISKWLLGLLGASLLPFLAPKKLIQMGISQDTFWGRAVFRIATFAFLVGVPLAIVGFLGMRNISESADNPNDDIRAGDIRNWPAFAAILGGRHLQPTGEDRDKLENLRQQFENGLLKKDDVDEYVRLRVRELIEARKELTVAEKKLDEYGRLSRIFYFAGWPLLNETPVSRAWNAQRAFETQQEEVVRLINRYVINSPLLPIALAKDVPLDRIAELTNAQPPDSTDTTNLSGELSAGQLRELFVERAINDEKILKDTELKETLNDAELSYKTLWTEDDAKSFNLAMLRKLHPECFYTENKAYRWIVTAGDEWFRLKVLGWALLAFCVGLTVDMNRTSLHRFYRNRLTRAYLVPQSPARPDVNLSDLNTTDMGAPYHLINTTLELTRPRFLDEVDEECNKANVDRRDRQIFLFSQLFCGATATGWVPTKEYESYLKENVSLGDAMALSGAASDAMLTNSLPITVLMTALNLSLGQWMPNPKKGWPWSNARAGVLLRDWFRPVDQADYCFVCDGGFTDNLGILQLLRRRCQVIIALDSTCDGNHEFADLGVVLRTARIEEGIRIVESSSQCQTLDTRPLERDADGMCQRHFLLARILYPQNSRGPETTGWLVYLKPSFTRDEGSDLLDYRRQQREFPHDTTADQFYDATRLESYRQLGAHIATTLCNELKSVGATVPVHDRLTALNSRLTSQPPAEPPLTSSVHAMAESASAATTKLGEVVQSLDSFQSSTERISKSLTSGGSHLKETSDVIAQRLAALEQQVARVAETQESIAKLIQSVDFSRKPADEPAGHKSGDGNGATIPAKSAVPKSRRRK